MTMPNLLTLFSKRGTTAALATMTNFSVQKLKLSNGQDLELGSNDIVLVVGRNSSGKSTFLREILSSVRDYTDRRKIISTAIFQGAGEGDLRSRVHSYFRVITDGTLQYVLNATGGREFYIPSFAGGPDKLQLGGGASAFVTLLDAEGRLSLTKDVETLDIYASKPRHPFHVFMVEPDKLLSTSKIVEQAFGLRLTINRIGNPIRGYVAPGLRHGDDLSSDKTLPERAELLVNQGDGLRSFAGIVGEVDAMSHPIVLIDEPEAFLHPPQSKRLGRNIVKSLGADRQAFIATHDSNFLQGAIARLNPRLRVLRLERAKGTFRVIDIRHADLKQAEALPSLANTNLLDSLFYDQTIVCEGDADCKLFEGLIADDEHDRFWFSASGKQQYEKVARILTGFGVDWRAILDLDVLLNWPIIESLASLKGVSISGHKKPVQAALQAMRPVDLCAIRAAAVSALSTNVGDDAAILDALRELDARKTSTPLKQHGLSAVPKGQERAVVEALLKDLATVGILLLRRGEIESYVPTVGGHGPSWVNRVLQDRKRHQADLSELTEELRQIT